MTRAGILLQNDGPMFSAFLHYVLHPRIWGTLVLALSLGCSATKQDRGRAITPSGAARAAPEREPAHVTSTQPVINTPLEADPLLWRASQLESFFATQPREFDLGFFSPDMQKAAEDVGRDIARLKAEGGPLRVLKLLSRTQRSGESLGGSFEAKFTNRKAAKIRLYVDANKPHAVTGLWFAALQPDISIIEEASEEFKRMPGKVSFAICRLEDSKVETVAAHNPDEPLAIASTFKLYVLGQLVSDVAAGKRRWDEVVRLDERYRSVPSGLLQDWPTGAPITLHTLASLMISKSDNTATDHLVYTLGRERIERMLAPMGNHSAGKNAPLISTAEMFKLKESNGETLANAYLERTVEDRRKFLTKDVANISLSGISWKKSPHFVDSLEWFASANDLCRAMNFLRIHTEHKTTSAARQILSINTGALGSSTAFNFVGFKSGSESGVTNLTYLLNTKDKTWWAVSAGWNDSANAENKDIAGLVERVLDLIPQLPSPRL